MEFLLIGLVSAFNMIVIKMKISRKRYEDASFDVVLLGLLTVLFSGSYGGMVVAMVASLTISIYLFISPPTFFKEAAKHIKKEIDEINGTKPQSEKDRRAKEVLDYMDKHKL